MLVSIIDKIASQANRYGKHLWLFRVRGNMLEICVDSASRKDPDQFRHAVICIGQVLQAVNYQAALNGQKTQIQSLPSLNEKHLVGIIRLQKNDEELSQKERIEQIISGSGQPVETFLNALAIHYGMCLKEIPQEAVANQKLKNFLAEFSGEITGKQCKVLCSKTDNLFMWLKTGYWKERVLQLMEETPSFPDNKINNLLHQHMRSGLNGYLEDSCYSQVLIYF